MSHKKLCEADIRFLWRLDEIVILEFALISCGFNLRKYHWKKLAAQAFINKSTPRNYKISWGVVVASIFCRKVIYKPKTAHKQ